MERKIYKTVFLFIMLLLPCIVFTSCGKKNEAAKQEKELSVNFSGDAKVSVGSFYVGAEFHHSSIQPQRISFYYPVANSIDLSTDYWYRDTTFINALGLQIGNGPRQWLGLHPYEYNLTPYKVTFHKEDSVKAVKVTYQFCKDKPAMVVTYEITNRSNNTEDYSFYTHLETSLKTCHTYALKDKAVTSYDKSGSTIYADFNDIGTQFARVFVANAGEMPASYNTIGDLNNSRKPGNDYWYEHGGPLPEKVLDKDIPGIPAAEYLYKKKLAPNETMKVVQIIGSCKISEGNSIVDYLLKNYEKEVKAYEDYAIKKSFDDGKFKTGIKSIDHSAEWSKAILAANKHYIDGDIIPMPCPAEYNFYFTHDVLLTDLAAVNFDLARVKHDLTFVAEHSSADKVIPHAFYWKDSAYATEYADADNWNNFWVIITTASYLRHSNDTSFANFMYPYLTKSLENALHTKKEDDVMWSYRPDWWDIGNNFGPRAYMTILAVKSLREYNYVSTVLGKNPNKLLENDKLADRMEAKLVPVFWSGKYNYLMSYFNDGKIDPHYYIGSLLAVDYGMLDKEHTDLLLQTTKEKLLDPKVGVYTAFPMDFLKFEKKLGYGDEVGKPYYYFNGGIWPQDNSWYASALAANGNKKEAFDFLNTTMTLEGIMNGPNGQPAMYEVRNADKDNPAVYGSVDKPQFMWAGGWYLYSIYHLFGINENDWNISFSPYLAPGQTSTEFSLNAYGENLLVKVTGSGKYIRSIKYGDSAYPSAVIPSSLSKVKNVNIMLGEPDSPYLESTNSSLLSCSYNGAMKSLKAVFAAFPGHSSTALLISTSEPETVTVDGSPVSTKNISVEKSGDVYRTTVKFDHKDTDADLVIVYR